MRIKVVFKKKNKFKKNFIHCNNCQNSLANTFLNCLAKNLYMFTIISILKIIKILVF